MRFDFPGFGRWKRGAGSIACARSSVEIRKIATVNISYSQISSVHVSHGGLLSKAFIQIVGSGETAVSNGRDASRHPCCLSFRRADRMSVLELKAEIERRVGVARREFREAASTPLGRSQAPDAPSA